MKSIDDLRKMKLIATVEDERGWPHAVTVDTNAIADQIEDEIGDLYFPRPLFEDGEPVCFGDEVLFDGDKPWGRSWKVETIGYDQECFLFFADEDIRRIRSFAAEIPYGERLKRPPKRDDLSEPDTQDAIDNDAALLPPIYCDHHGILTEGMDGIDEIRAMMRHLLKRQRKLDGVI